MAQTTNTLEKLQLLETLYQKGYQNEVADRALEKILDLERAKAEQTLSDLRQQLRGFESRYHLTSHDFYQQFHHGQLGDDPDYFEWSACYDMYQAVSVRLHTLAAENS
jgi:hypothetical protein